MSGAALPAPPPRSPSLNGHRANGAARLLILDSDALFRDALEAAFEAENHLRVVGGAGTAAGALTEAARTRPDVVLMEAALPGDGIGACRSLKERTAAQVVVVGERADQAQLIAALEAGADGYASKDMELSQLIAAVRQVLGGEAHVPGVMLGPLLHRLLQRRRTADRGQQLMLRLTRREREVLELLLEGCDPETVAQILVISSETARKHIQHVIAKFGVHSRLEVGAVASEYEMLERLRAVRRTPADAG